MLISLAVASIVEKLLPMERDYFLWINHHRSEFFDTFMYLYSNKFTWALAGLTLLTILLYKVDWKNILLLILCGLLIGVMCDFIVSELVKPFFGRSRPFWHPDFQGQVQYVLDYKGGKFGFISNHAANGFGIAIFTSLIFRYKYYTLVTYTWAIITAYSRIYLGVHFITDVLGGIIWGSLVGLVAYLLFYYSRKLVLKTPTGELSQPLISGKCTHIVMLTLLLTLIYILGRSLFFQID